MINHIPSEILITLELLIYAFILIFISLILGLIVLYIYDRFQRKSTLRRNYPIVANFRYFFEHIGGFLRQYFFALDRDEMPFNRSQRSWCYRAAKNVDSTVAFGSTKNIHTQGSYHFVSSLFPTLSKDSKAPANIIIGPYAKNPYTTNSIINISAMSYGAISAPAIKALSRGAKMAGIWLNTGEGGLSSYHLEGDCDLIYQIGTAKFGVRKPEGGFDEEKLKAIADHEQVKMFEIKLSQGAKPGKGGILPGAKVTKEIAIIRGVEEGKDTLSPNRHSEINSLDDLLDMVQYVRETTGKPVGFKTVIGSYWVDDLCEIINKRGIESAPDFIAIDSSEGGTGAAPLSLMDNMGIPISDALPKVINILNKHKLKDRIKIIASGKLLNPAEAAWALCAGADFVVSARGFMFALGCIQALHCNKNTCPTGITTHKKKLQHGLDPQDKAIRVSNFAKNMVKELSIIANSCGTDNPRGLNRDHVLIVGYDGKGKKMDES
ncbi:MAG: glutamate synthase domain-containing protein 2 [Lentimonas sp.]|jgi:glutamate synthase domain-containing protein 2